PAIDEIPAIDERPEADKRPVIHEKPLVDERSTIDEMPDNVPELNEDNNKSESNEMEDEIYQEDEIINLNLQGVKNPNKVTGRGQPPKRRYLSSVEKNQSTRGGSKTRGSYKCGVCQQVGHNAAFHK
ncbi:8356_t:CDS:1, partial [Gigaspora rosea]